MTEEMREQQRLVGVKMREPDYLGLPRSVLGRAADVSEVRAVSPWWRRWWAWLRGWLRWS